MLYPIELGVLVQAAREPVWTSLNLNGGPGAVKMKQNEGRARDLGR